MPLLNRNGCWAPLAVCAQPVTCPERLIAAPELLAPPSVPRSCIVPLLYRNA